MKLALILLLVCSIVFSTRVAPNTQLPQSFHNAMVNSLRGVPSGIERMRKTVRHSVSKLFTAANLKNAMDFVSEQLPWMTVESKMAILNDAKELGEEEMSSHFVSQGDLKVRYQAVVNIVKEDGVMKIVVSQDTVKTEVKTLAITYHQKRTSKIGMPLSAAEQITKIQIGEKELKFLESRRQKLLVSLKETLGTRASSMRAATMLGNISPLTAFTSVMNAWKSIADNFKNTFSTTLKGITKGKGFSKYSIDSAIFVHEGIRLSRWSIFKPNYIIAIGFDENAELAFKADNWLELATFVDSNTVMVNDLVFDIKKDGICTSTVVMNSKDDVLQKLHLLTAVVSGAFTLYPDTYIYEVNKSYAGGIYQEVKEKREYRARAITEGDIKALTALASINAINRFSQHFGIKFELPTDDPTDLCKK